MADQAPPEPPADAGQKLKKKRIQRDFQETARWEHDEHREDDIVDGIRSELKIVNDRAGLKFMPGAHKGRDDRYGLFVTGNTWLTNKGSITNTILRCPLWERCQCPCEAKIVTTSTTTVLYISHPHTPQHHGKDKDKSVFLSYEEKTFVKKAVKISPMQSAGDLFRNVQDTDEAIDFSLKKSVQYHVRKERRGIRAYLLDDVEVDDTLGSLSRLSDKIWFKTALDQHNAGQCMDLFKVYCIGRQFMTEDRAVMISFSSVWNLLNFWRSVASCYNTQIVMDVTHKCSTAAINKHAIGVNMLGGKAAPVTFTLIPAQTESEATHTEAYHAMRKALRALTAVKTCDSCECCRCISDLRTDHIVKCALRSPHYITKHELPVSHGLSDNSWGFQNFMKNVLGIEAELCQTHATAIAANNGTHRRYFKDEEKYEKFYGMLCDIMRITCEPAGYYLQSLLVKWLRTNVDNRCADWFETYWTGQVKGRYLLGSGGVGLVSNNQSL